MIIQKVGIIGAGTMGNGIAQACAVVGIPVVMVDISEAAVAKGIATVSGSLDRLLKKEKITEADKAAALSKIQGSTQYEDLTSADLVIEAATDSFFNDILNCRLVNDGEHFFRHGLGSGKESCPHSRCRNDCFSN